MGQCSAQQGRLFLVDLCNASTREAANLYLDRLKVTGLVTDPLHRLKGINMFSIRLQQYALVDRSRHCHCGTLCSLTLGAGAGAGRRSFQLLLQFSPVTRLR